MGRHKQDATVESLTIPAMDPATGDESRVLASLSVVQEVLDYMFKPRPGGRVPWLDDPERFEYLRREWKRRLTEGSVTLPVRKSWEEHAWLLRQGEGSLSWNQIAEIVGKNRSTVRVGVVKFERARRAALAAVEAAQAAA